MLFKWLSPAYWTRRSKARLAIDCSVRRYLLHGFGGNYCWQLESPVTGYTLANLAVRWARAAMNLSAWHQDPSLVRAELELMRRLQDRGIPYIASAWRLPERLPSGLESLDLITSYLIHARDAYGVEPDLFSFNEPDIGIQVLFTPEEHRLLIRALGARLESLGLKTRLLLGDVGNPRGTIAFTRPTVADPSAMRYVAAVSFHSWGGAAPSQYREWGDLAQSLGLPLIVAEMGTDPEAWRTRAWDSYDYGLQELRQYQELLLHARPQAVLYWQFTGDYALCRVTESGVEPTGRFWLMKHFTNLTPPMSHALAAKSGRPDVLVTAFRNADACAVHIANTGEAREATLAGLPAETRAWRAVITTEEQGFQHQPPLIAEGGRLSLSLPPRSLLTLVSR